ncbi:MAG: hypothetical protein HYX20_03980 [Candidatus Yanofskybacteria bacterium]|nr:hypothetical protein [Candidatus Yanofskybacteria bacterium]
MKKNKFLFMCLVVLGSFLYFADTSNAATCSLSFSSPHGSYIAVGDRVTWTLTSSFSNGKSYWFGTKNGVTDVSTMDTTFGNPFSWTTDPYPSDTIGNYTRWVQVKDINGNFLCQTATVFVSVTAAPTPIPTPTPTPTPAMLPTASLSVTPSTVTAGQNLTYSWSSTNATAWSWGLAIYKNGVWQTSDACVNQSSSNWSGPQGGNSAQGFWTGVTVSCQAGYTYHITYKATNSSGAAISQPVIVTVTAATPMPTPVPTPTPSSTSTPTSTTTASLNFTATESTNPVFRVGNSFILNLTSNQYSQPFYLCSTLTGNPSGYNHTNRCTSTTLTTNSSGRYAWNGTWDSTNIGTWTEWVRFPNTPGGYNSPTITFTIAQSTIVQEELRLVAPGVFSLTVDYNNDVIRSGYFYIEAAFESLFSKYKDDMDAIVLVPTASLINSVEGRGICTCAWGVRKLVEGIGYPYGGITGDSRFFSLSLIPIYAGAQDSDQAIKAAFMPNLLHEIGHGWSTFIARGRDYKNPLKILEEQQFSHWGYISDNFDSVMAYGPARMIDNKDGTFTPVWKFREELDFNDFDLYTMGLLPPEKVKPTFSIFNAASVKNINDIRGNRRDVTINDIINLEGTRNPTFGLTRNNQSNNIRVTFLIAHNLDGSASDLEKAMTITKQMADLLPSHWNKAAKGTSTASVFTPPLKVASNKKTLAVLQSKTNEELRKEVIDILNQTHDDGPASRRSIQEQQQDFQKALEKKSISKQSLPSSPTIDDTLLPTPSLTPLPTPTPPINQARLYSLSEIYDGDLIRGQGDIAVWIIKIVGEKRYKRWLFGPQIFNAYGHLSFDKVKNVSKVTLNNFDTSNLIRKFDDEKVYELTDFVPGKSATRRWIQTLEIFLQRGFDFDAVYIVNQREFDLYTEGSPLPVTMREKEAKNNLPLTANISDAMLRFLGLTAR